VRRWTVPLIVLAAVLGLCAPATAKPGLPDSWMRGMNWTAWWNDAYATPEAQASLDQAAGLGSNAVSVLATWYQDGPRASVVAPDRERTPSDASLRVAVERAHRAGLKVFLRPTVDARAGGWRGRFRPADADRWFAGYRAMVDHYAALAQSLGVEALQIGTELRGLSGARYEARWRAIARSARAQFDGTLTYAANWDEFRQITWWDAVDVIGIDAYFPLSRRTRPSVAALTAAWSSYTDAAGREHHYLRDIAATAARYGRKVWLTELGYPSAAGSLAAPFDVGAGSYDAAAQQRALTAAFTALRDRSWMGGVFLWQWRATGAAGGPGDRDHTVQGKPGAELVRRWFSGAVR
jgi:GTA TIM-barrel-like domain